MKRVFIIVALFLSNFIFAQNDTVPPISGFAPESRRVVKTFTADEYLKKSRGQAFVGTALVSAALITSTIVAVDATKSTEPILGRIVGQALGGQPAPKKKRSYTLPISLSVVAILGGIFVLNEAKENRSSAKFASVHLKMEDVTRLHNAVQNNASIPAFELRLKL